jgi:hypothetical protein
MIPRALLAMLLTVSTVQAQQPPQVAAAPSDFSLTVYSTADPKTFDPQQLARDQVSSGESSNREPLPGYGVVRETRKIDLAAGENTVRFTDVAAGIDPTTVSFESKTAPDTTAVLEQNYEYDLVSFSALLEKFINRQISITRNARTFKATLLASDANSIIYREGDDPNGPVQVMARDPGAIQLPDTRGLNTRPTLVWKVSAQRAGQHDAQVTYQTDGITWRADYNVVVDKDDKTCDIGAWVTLLNQSGASYPNAKVKLVAGDVQRFKPIEPRYASLGMGGGGRAPEVTEKPFFEYHLYTLTRPTTLAQNSTKQIELFPQRKDVPITKSYTYYGASPQIRTYTSGTYTGRGFDSTVNNKVDVYLKTKNNEKNGMGVPLPAGRIRVYKQNDADASLEFVGEDVIDHTPKDEDVLMRMGSAFDIVGDRKQTDYQINQNEHWVTESFQITVRNHKKEPIQVTIKENLYRTLNWEITKNSDNYEKQDYRTINIPIDVPVDGEKIVSYSVKYTW